MTTQADVLIQAFQATSLPVLITDAAGKITAVNAAFTGQTGWRSDEIIGRSPSVFASGRHNADFYEAMWSALESKGRWQGELWNRRKCGTVVPDYLTIDAVRDRKGAVTHYVGLFSSVAAQKRCEGRYADLAFRDPATGLPNRRLCEDRLERALALARRRAGHLALHLIDLDGFKALRTNLGPEYADLILKAAGERQRACLRECDTIARWGEKAFAVILPAVDSAAGARETGLRLLNALRRPFVLAGDEIKLGCSIGAAIFPGDGDSVEEIVACAERTLLGVKREAKGGFALHGDGAPGADLRRRA